MFCLGYNSGGAITSPPFPLTSVLITRLKMFVARFVGRRNVDPLEVSIPSWDYILSNGKTIATGTLADSASFLELSPLVLVMQAADPTLDGPPLAALLENCGTLCGQSNAMSSLRILWRP